MFAIILTILAVGAFFILFFKSPVTPPEDPEKEKEKEKEKPSTNAAAVGFVEDTGLDSYGAVFERGDMGTFVAHDTVPEDSWMSGTPYLEETVEVDV